MFIFMGLPCSNAWSQESYPKFDFVSITEGISKVGIYSILQDDYGFIWIGTNGSGLYRYDGMEYKSYKHVLNDSTSLNSSLVFSTYLDSKNRLWVGTEEGLNLYDRDHDRFIGIRLGDKGEIDNVVSVSSLQEDNQGNLYIGGFEKGLFKLDLENFNVEKIKVGKPDSSNPLVVQTIQMDSYGKIYVGTSLGLFDLDERSGFLTRSYFRGENTMDAVYASIKSLLIDEGDNIWIGTFSEGLQKVGRTDMEGADFYTIDKFLFS